MNRKFSEAINKQRTLSSQAEITYSGILGIPIGGQLVVEVPGRNSYVYVQLRNSPNEVIQAFNDKVSPAYQLPVLVEYQGNRYVIIGRDTLRYANWQSYSSYLPRHGLQHSLPDDFTQGGGGDVSFIYPRQITPALVMPSGSLGAPDVILNPYTMRNPADGTWKYTGNTGTIDLTIYNPTGSSAVMVLVCLDTATGNPQYIVGSGSYFPNNYTGTSVIPAYIPSLTNNAMTTSIPLSAIRLVSGTSSIGWDNIYDVRQWVRPISSGTGGGGGLSNVSIQDEGILKGSATGFNFRGANVTATVSGTWADVFVTGSSGGGGGTPSSPNGSVQYNAGGAFGGSSEFLFDAPTSVLTIGGTPPANGTNALHLLFDGGMPSNNVWGFATGTVSQTYAPQYQFWRADGTLASPANVKNGMGLGRLNVRGYKATTWSNTIAQILFRATADFTDTSAPTAIDFYTTPSGTTTQALAATFNSDGSLDVETHQVHNLTAGTVTTDAANVGQLPTIEVQSYDIFRVDNPGGTSVWTGTITGIAGSVVTVSNPTSGQEAILVPTSTNQLAKLRLYNLTRANHALIFNYAPTTNQCTLTAAPPANWANGDSLTIASNTVSGGGWPLADIELTSGPLGRSGIFLNVAVLTGLVGDFAILHPYEAFSYSKSANPHTLAAEQVTVVCFPIKINGNVLSFSLNGSWAVGYNAFVLREAAYIP